MRPFSKIFVAFLAVIPSFISVDGFDDVFVPSECPGAEWFKCVKDGACVMNLWRCDGEKDCEDGTDEDNCDIDFIGRQPQRGLPYSDVAPMLGIWNSTKLDCEATEFQCDNKMTCIPNLWVCDKKADCSDESDEDQSRCDAAMRSVCGSDEKNSGMEDMRQCGTDTKCVPSRWFCDGTDDCPNGFDEVNCNFDTSTDIDINDCGEEFSCHRSVGGNASVCIPWDKVCDRNDDCPDGDDESDNCQVSCNDVICDQECRPMPYGKGTCTCSKGHAMGDDGHCSDVDECEEQFGVCSQICNNWIGGYSCSCEDGYRLENDETTCTAINDPAILIFSGISQIRGMDLRRRNYFLVSDSPFIGHAVGIAYDGVDDKVYWTDVASKPNATIRSSKLDGTLLHTVVNDGLSKPEDVAIDYVARNIYFTDIELQMVGVCKLDGRYCQPLIDTGIDKPRGIDVLPQAGLIVFSDWGQHPRIARAGTDGRDVTTLVSDKLRWPNGVSIDAPTKRVFWADAYFDTIESIRLDGTGRHEIDVEHNNMMLHPFSVAVFEDTVYFSDFGMREIQACHKFTGKNHRVLVKEAKLNPHGLTVFHPLIQRLSYSPCTASRCSHMCLISSGGSGYECRCPHNMEMSENGHTCHLNEYLVQILTLPEDIDKSLPQAFSTTTTTSTSIPRSKRVESSSTASTPKVPPSLLWFFETTSPKPRMSVVKMDNVGEIGDNDNDNNPSSNVNFVIGLVIGIGFPLLLILLAFYCFWKRRSNKAFGLLGTTENGGSGVRHQTVLFRNPSFGLENGLKDGKESRTTSKTDDELKWIEVIRSNGKQLEDVAAKVGGPLDLIDYNNLSDVNRYSASPGSGPTSDHYDMPNDDEKCQLIDEDD